MSFLFTLCTVCLVLVSLFLILIVLMQRASSNSGIGSALAGGLSEATFGAESTSVLSRWTVYAAVIFFLLSFVLYLGYMGTTRKTLDLDQALPALNPVETVEEVEIEDPVAPTTIESTITVEPETLPLPTSEIADEIPAVTEPLLESGVEEGLNK